MEEKKSPQPGRPNAAVWMVIALAGILLLCGCAQAPADFDAVRVTAELDALLGRDVRDENGEAARHAVLYIEAPTVSFEYSGAAGIARVDTGEPMTAQRPFYIASVAKAMTAAVIHQLAEEGAFGPEGIDARLADLDVLPADVLPELHRRNGESFANEITLRHLLNQTSGLRDVFFDDPVAPVSLMPGTAAGAAPGSMIGVTALDPEFGLAPQMNCVLRGNPDGCDPDAYLLRRSWTVWDYPAWKKDPDDRMAGLLNFYLAEMNTHALWKPGEGFHYSDTNYILLGLVIEKQTGQNLADVLRARVFEPLGMRETYLIHPGDFTDGKGRESVADVWAWNEPAMSGGVDFSFDWGGGGVISTLDDLKVFVRSLAAGRLFRDPETVDRMLAVPEGIAGLYYASGMIVFPTADGPVWYMMGSNGTWVEFFPPADLVMIGTTDDLSEMPRQFMLHIEIAQILASGGLSTPMATMASPFLMLLMGALALLFPLQILWLIRAWRGLRRKESATPVPAPVHGLVAAALLVNLLLMTLIGATFGENIFQILFGFSPEVRMLFTVSAFLLGTFALGMGWAAAFLWHRHRGSLMDRWMLLCAALISLAAAACFGGLG